MNHYTKHLLVLFLFGLLIDSYSQIDSMIMYDPYELTKTDIIITYDIDSSIERQVGSIGDFGNRKDLDLTLPDTIINTFTNNILASDNYDMLSFPVRANVAMLHYRFTKDRKSGGGGILVSPNAVLTAGHVIGYEANHVDLGTIFRWNDSIVVSPSHQNGNPQESIGTIKVNKCYVFKSFVNSLGHIVSDDIALMILDQPIGYDIGWLGLGYVATDSFLLDNVFYNFSYPGVDGYDGLNMYYKYGRFSYVSLDLIIATNDIGAVRGESGSAFFHTDNLNYTVYGIRTYESCYTLITEHKYRILSKLIKQSYVPKKISKADGNQRLIVYPNPAKNFVTVEMSDLIGTNNKCLLCNTQGQIVYEKTINEETFSLDVRSLQTGLYVLIIISEQETLIIKVIIE